MKGLSTVVSSVLLLAISVSLVSIYAGWAPDFAENIVGDAANQTNTDIKCSNAAVSIDNVTYDITGETADVKVENTGTIRFTDKVRVGIFNSSTVVGRDKFSQLDVGETHEISIDSQKVPEKVVVSTTECPGINEEETFISVKQ